MPHGNNNNKTSKSSKRSGRKGKRSDRHKGSGRRARSSSVVVVSKPRAKQPKAVVVKADPVHLKVNRRYVHVDKQMNVVGRKLTKSIVSAGKESLRPALAAITLPWGHSARLDDESNVGTAVFNPFGIYTRDQTFPLGLVPNIGLAVPANMYLAGVSRDPLHAKLETLITPNWGEATCGSWCYFATFAVMIPGLNTTLPRTAYILEASNYSVPVDTVPMLNRTFQLNPIHFSSKWNIYGDIPVWGTRTAWEPFSTHRFPRTVPGSDTHYFWLATGETIAISTRTVAGAVPAATTLKLMVKQYVQNGGATEYAWEATGGAAEVNWVVPAYGWYSIAVQFSAATAFTYINAFLSTVAPPPSKWASAYTMKSPDIVCAITPLPGIMERMTINTHRVIGASITFTPDVMEYVKECRFAAVTLTGQQSFTLTQFLNSSSNNDCQGLTSLAAAVSGISESMNGAKGAYVFARPLSVAELEMRQVFNHNPAYTGVMTDRDNALESLIKTESGFADSWTLLAVQFPPNAGMGTSVHPGALFHTTFAYCLEGHTNDPWYNRALGQKTDLHALVVALKGAKLLHDNPFHISDLRRWYNSAMPYAKFVAPTLLRLLASFHPAAATAGSAIMGALPAEL